MLTLTVEAEVTRSAGVTVFSGEFRFTHTCIGARVPPTGVPFCTCSTALAICTTQEHNKKCMRNQRIRMRLKSGWIKNLHQVESNWIKSRSYWWVPLQVWPLHWCTPLTEINTSKQMVQSTRRISLHAYILITCLIAEIIIHTGWIQLKYTAWKLQRHTETYGSIQGSLRIPPHMCHSSLRCSWVYSNSVRSDPHMCRQWTQTHTDTLQNTWENHGKASKRKEHALSVSVSVCMHTVQLNFHSYLRMTSAVIN